MGESKERVREIVKEAKHTLRDVQNGGNFEQELCHVRSLLVKTSSQGASSEEQKEFMKTQYASFLSFLIDQISVDWIRCLPQGKICELVDVFFTEGHPVDAFLVLCHGISKSSPGYKLSKCVSLVESLLTGRGGVASLLLSQCTPGDGTTMSTTQQQRGEQWEELVTCLVTLPDRVTNKLHKQAGDLFYPEHYVRHMCGLFMDTLQEVHRRLVSGQSSRLDFLSLLLGKMSLHGHADMIWTYLLPLLVPLVRDEPLWARVCERLVAGVPHRYIHSVVTALTKQIPWYGYMSHFLGNSVLSNSRLTFLLTNKLLLQSYTDKHLVIQNIIGYLTSSGTLRPLFIKVFHEVLSVWGDSSALKHTPYEQHLYLSRILMVCVAFAEQSAIDQINKDGRLLSLLMSGMQCHLECVQPGVRTQGMVVAEAITALVNPNADKLDFQYDDTDEVRHLKSLLEKPLDPGLESLLKDVQDLKMDTSAVHPDPNQHGNPPLEEELDSDDDLEPFDMSHDKKKSQEKPPMYLRDCLEGLISSEESHYIDLCLVTAEKLIRQHPGPVEEVCEEFMKVLLHMSHDHNVLLRLSTMVALTATCPKTSAMYLTSQLYERNYSISHRLDILQVLTASAQELSSPPKATTPAPPKPSSILSDTPDTSNDNPHWRQIVEQRIQSNTRIISKGRALPKPSAANRFAPVAGCFFFPLLNKFDQKQSWLDLFGEDHLVLTRLTYTLGVVINAAINAPILSQMAPALIEYILFVRYHNQAAVRQGVLFSTCMLLMAVPAHILLTQIAMELAEIKQWLHSVAEKDTDMECRKLAVQAILLIEKAVKQEFETTDR